MKNFLIAAAFSVASVTFADAAVVGFTSGVIEGNGAVSSNGDVTSFSWNSTQNVEQFDNPFAAFVAFEIDSTSDITLNSYSDDGGGLPVRVSGILFERTDSLNGSLSIDGLLSTDVSGCGSQFFSAIFIPSCNYVAASDYTGDGSDIATTPGELLFTDLAAGFYRLTFLETGSPALGSASVEVSAVLLPAGAPLLLSALGGLAFIRRSRRT